MKELKLNLLETSFAPLPPRRDLGIHFSSIENPPGPGILSHDKPSLLETFLTGCVEVVSVLHLVELYQDWLHRVVYRTLFPTKEVLGTKEI